MARMMSAPELNHADLTFLKAAGDDCLPVASVLWPDFPSAVAQVAARPSTIKKVPARWVPFVVRVMDKSDVPAVADADSRLCTTSACSTRCPDQDEDSSQNRPAEARDVTPVEALTALVDAAEPPTDADIEALGEVLSLSHIDAAAVELAVRLWGRPDWSHDGKASLAKVLLGKMGIALLTRTPVWSWPERCLFLLVCAGFDGYGSPRTPTTALWEIATAVTPTFDIADRQELDNEAVRLGLDPRNPTLPLALLYTVVGVAPAFDTLSSKYWAEHTGLVLLWAARSAPQTRDTILSAHRKFLADAPARRNTVERSSRVEDSKRILELLGDDTEMRVSLSGHFRRGADVSMWLEAAQPHEVALWQQLLLSTGAVNTGVLCELVTDSSAMPAEVLRYFMSHTPGVLASVRTVGNYRLASVVIGLLRAEFGDDVALWTTAFSIGSPETTLAEVVTVTRAIHTGPV